jgi:hypothetical protein
MAVLNGQASIVAAAIRRKTTRRRLTPAQRRGADHCASYLLNKRDYPTALANGWPIATGIIEGAEAVLKLRALGANGDFDNYWDWHLTQDQHRIHETRYANNDIPHAA